MVKRQRIKGLSGVLHQVVGISKVTDIALKEAGFNPSKEKASEIFENMRDNVVGKTYIQGANGNFYRVPESEMDKFDNHLHQRFGNNKPDYEGLPVIFQTPVKKTGKNVWAYDLKMCDE